MNTTRTMTRRRYMYEKYIEMDIIIYMYYPVVKNIYYI